MHMPPGLHKWIAGYLRVGNRQNTSMLTADGPEMEAVYYSDALIAEWTGVCFHWKTGKCRESHGLR